MLGCEIGDVLSLTCASCAGIMIANSVLDLIAKSSNAEF